MGYARSLNILQFTSASATGQKTGSKTSSWIETGEYTNLRPFIRVSTTGGAVVKTCKFIFEQSPDKLNIFLVKAWDTINAATSLGGTSDSFKPSVYSRLRAVVTGATSQYSVTGYLVGNANI